jgi:hypothetical protein
MGEHKIEEQNWVKLNNKIMNKQDSIGGLWASICIKEKKHALSGPCAKAFVRKAIIESSYWGRSCLRIWHVMTKLFFGVTRGAFVFDG